MTVDLARPRAGALRSGLDRTPAGRAVPLLCGLLAVAAMGSALTGLLLGGGPGRHAAQTARGASVMLYGEGLYAADSWLVGAGNRGQDVVMLLVEVPLLLLAVRWFRRGSPAGAVALAGVLTFFAYFFTSLVFATAQNVLFPAYVVAFGLSWFTLVTLLAGLDVDRVAREFPRHPSPKALTAYLLLVALALLAAWLPPLVVSATTGDIAGHVGPYTSSATHALDLGLVVPLAVLAAVLLTRRAPGGYLLTALMLVLNVCIGVLLVGQGTAQLLLDVPLTTGEIVGKMLSFAVLTLLAAGLLARLVGGLGAVSGTERSVSREAEER